MGKKRQAKPAGARSVPSSSVHNQNHVVVDASSTAKPGTTGNGYKHCNDSNDTAIIQSFQQWVRSLNWKDLQDALTFSVSGNIPTASSSSSWPQRTELQLQKQQSELDLLCEMVRLQPALPTPIHPRAISFSPASARGKSYWDGRYLSPKDEYHARWDRPRLFQLLPRATTANHTFWSSSNMEEQEAELLAMLTGNAPALAHRKSANTIQRKDWFGRKRRNPVASSNAAYDVIARQFRQDDGELLSMASTESARQADELLVRSTILYQCKDSSGYGCRLNFRKVANASTSQKVVLDILRRASRGNFGTVARKSDDQGLLPSWLDAENRWFHLAMYLAGRFEVTLWNSFYQQLYKTATLAPPQRSPIPVMDHLSDGVVESLYAVAVITSLRDSMAEDHRPLVKSGHVRDSAIWGVLTENDGSFLMSSLELDTVPRRVAEELWSTPVAELGSSATHWRERIRGNFRTVYAAYMERLLLDERGAVSDDTSKTNNTKSRKAKRNGNRGRERDQAVVSWNNHHEKQSDGDTFLSLSSSSETSDEEEGLLIVGGTQNVQSQHTTRKSEAHSRTSHSMQERNRNTVTVMSILEGLMDNVFRDVGLNDPTRTSCKGTSAATFPDGNGCEIGETPFQLIESERRAVVKSSMSSQKNSSKQHPDDSKPNKSKAPNNKKFGQGIAAKQAEANRKKEGSQTSGNSQKRSHPKPTSYANAVNTNRRQQDTSTVWSTENGGFPSLQENYGLPEDASATVRTSNQEGIQTQTQNGVSAGFFSPPDSYTFGSAGWGGSGSSVLDEWGRFRGFDGRDESILTEFFYSQERAQQNRDEMVMASSTAVSVASSFDKEHEALIRSLDEIDVLSDEEQTTNFASMRELVLTPDAEDGPRDSIIEEDHDEPLKEVSPLSDGNRYILDEARASFPSPPTTPPPTLSPILVSLSELSELRKESFDGLQIPASKSLPSEPGAAPTSLPPSPRQPPSRTRTGASLPHGTLRIVSSAEDMEVKHGFKLFPRSSLSAIQTKIKPSSSPAASHEDHDAPGKVSVRGYAGALSSTKIQSLRPGISRDDHDIKPRAKEMPPRISYRNAAIRATLSSPMKSSVRDSAVRGSFSHFPFESMSVRKEMDGDICTQSETALDGQDDFHSFSESRRSRFVEVDNTAIAKDGSTTITSGASQHESDDVVLLREERNTYRDMCLTLGAEVAKLKALLAAQRQQHQPQILIGNRCEVGFKAIHGTGSFDPKTVPRSFNIAPRARTLAAMSDAGYRGEHESLASEDEIGAKAMPDGSRQFSSGITVAESDVSLEPAVSRVVNVSTNFQVRDDLDSMLMNGTHSRLARDIFQFIEATNAQLRKQDSRKQAALERITRLVCAVWPRAQVKVYGSHVTGLCVPSSDLDVVVCLPAVHKNAVAVAAGALEGRNAIRETSQKQLARRLKGESWIDPRSIKVIDRTVIPVIKVATKDTKARTLNLDISFDSPGHHGLEAVHMVQSIMGELPMLRPLVIVLKQFLIDRSLLQAYTGGLSPYCLFLMAARYLQEQESVADVGSLLMGFLDFYGNHFDPRTTAISVRHRTFFSRPRNQSRPPVWAGVVPVTSAPVAPAPGNISFLRRNSFSDRKSADFTMGNSPHIVPRPPSSVFQPTFHQVSALTAPQGGNEPQNSFDHGMPYTFDPLFVEDPLSGSEINNVGRNAFRIFQVQRAFSDAHRALVAALEWDMHSTGESQDANEFPLLKCLLQSEDVVLDL